MGKIYYTAEELEKLTIGDLRNVLVSVGGVPANKSKAVLIDEITRIVNGEFSPVRSKRGRPSTRMARVNKEDCVRDIGSLPDECEGMIELNPAGYAYVRTEYYEPSQDDAFVPASVVKKFVLREGDMVKGDIVYKRENKFPEMVNITRLNDSTPKCKKRPDLDHLTAYYPNSKIRLGLCGDPSMRMIDFFCPIGKGQRGLIVAPPNTGKTLLLKNIALAVERCHPEIEVIALLIDEYPEDVTEFKTGLRGEVMSSTFDKTVEHHIRVAEKCFSRAKALVEDGRDVIVLLDSITKLVRAYNVSIPAANRTPNEIVDHVAIQFVKKYFGYAKNTNVGSITVLATVLADTGSSVDDIILDEFLGTGNSEMVLTDKFENSGVFPTIDVMRSSTRREDLLLSRKDKGVENEIRRMIMRRMTTPADVVEAIKQTNDNVDFCEMFDEKSKKKK